MQVLSQVLPSVKNPGRVYRPMYCNACDGIRYHAVDFMIAERNDKGRFVWFNKVCTGNDAINGAHPKRLLKLSRECRHSEQSELPLAQWNRLIAGDYY